MRVPCCSHRFGRLACAAFLILVCIYVLPAWAQAPPERGPAVGPVSVAPIQGEAATLPPPSAKWLLILRPSPAIDLRDKGSTFTDAAFGEAHSAPNALEQEKLARARSAIEASRQAGTLVPLARPEIQGPPDPAQLEALKVTSVRGAPDPPQLVPDPAACVGVVPPPVQVPAEIGADGRPVSESAGTGKEGK